MKLIRYTERPDLWASSLEISHEVWPEYNQHGDVVSENWERLFDEFPAYQFVLYEDEVLGEGHTVPCCWDGTLDGLGEGIDAMADLARDAGLAHLIAPVRPTFKDRYPITPIERYVSWTNDAGEAFDPWIRVHLRRGGQIVKPVARSLRITGTVSEWEQWTGMRFPGDGAYTFSGGLAPVEIDRSADTGAYWEPNVWIVHAVENS
jgi:hypothetical protein